jgi:hypothetical protein
MSDESRQDTIRVLTHVKRDPKYRETMRVKFQISASTLAEITPRDFFVTLMTAVERIQPNMVALRAATARSATFARQEVVDDRATVFWDSPQGGSEKMVFVNEDGRWKPVIKR